MQTAQSLGADASDSADVFVINYVTKHNSWYTILGNVSILRILLYVYYT